MVFPVLLRRYRREFQSFLRSTVGEGSPPLLYRMMRYHLGWEDEQGRPLARGDGKALRPSLCLWACEAVGGDWRRALPAAAALELMHNFSLIHDDIQDGDTERRHRPTVWSLWGQPQAINAGDSLLALAHLALLRLADGGVEPAKVVRACAILDQACLAMIEGQCLDIGFEVNTEVSLEAYLEMIAKKSGALFEASLHLGALVGSDDESMMGRFGRCGRLLGMAFQMRDDMLGIWGKEEVSGKPIAADVRRRKKSLPVVYALASGGDAGDELVRLYAQEPLGDSDVERVVRILEGVGAYDYCQRMAQEHIDQALAELAAAKVSGSVYRQFRQVAQFILEREF
ncbi:MAG: polyprenyl synthetase family protein [Dehalococcoidia bacterium]